MLLSPIFISFIVSQVYPQPKLNIHYPLDTILIRHLDVTGDNKPERICLRLRAERSQDPFYWSIEVLAGKVSLFQFIESDSASDFIFSEDGQKPQDYLKNKYEFFFKKFANLEVSTRASVWEQIVNDPQEQRCILNQMPQQLIAEYNLSKSVAETAVKRILSDIIKAKMPLLLFSAGVDIEGPYVYCAECNHLVSIPFYTN